MKLKAYQSSEGWRCAACHLEVAECRCYPGDFHAHGHFHNDRFSSISDWMYKHYGFGYDTWRLRLQAACRHIGHQLEGGPLAFRCPDMPSAERVDRLIRIMMIRAKARKDVSSELAAIKATIKPRQMEVLRMISEGKSHQEISESMTITIEASRALLWRSRASARLVTTETVTF